MDSPLDGNAVTSLNMCASQWPEDGVQRVSVPSGEQPPVSHGHRLQSSEDTSLDMRKAWRLVLPQGSHLQRGPGDPQTILYRKPRWWEVTTG